MVRLEPCDRDSLAAALRLINEARDRGEHRDARGVNLHAAAINLDRIREDYDNGEDCDAPRVRVPLPPGAFDAPSPRCDDPGAHGPGCQCDGGEPVI
jgi:hypothetical protein